MWFRINVTTAWIGYDICRRAILKIRKPEKLSLSIGLRVATDGIGPLKPQARTAIAAERGHAHKKVTQKLSGERC